VDWQPEWIANDPSAWVENIDIDIWKMEDAPIMPTE